MSTSEIIIFIMLAISIAISSLSLAFSLRKRKSQDNFTALQEDFINERIADLYNMLAQDNKSETNTLLAAMNTSNTTMLAAQKNSQDGLKDIVQNLVNQQKQEAELLKSTLDIALAGIRSTLSSDLKDLKSESTTQALALRENLLNQIKLLETTVSASLEKIRDNNDKKLAEMIQSNETKLNEMRGTVEEKLQSTLHERITTSFSAVTSQLFEVQKGLGEMQNLTSNVSNLNRVLNGVKIRGIWGEVSLEGLLEQILSPSQYDKQVNIKNKNAVDFAVIMPGIDGNQTLLPIDAKFPFASYERLMEASERGDKDTILKERAELQKDIKLQAKSIASKYIDVPNTTNFAILYLPIEGLYAEIAREADIMHDIHTNYNVMLAGPTTLTALLTALQVGFRTLTMQKQSKEVWNTLQKFKKNINMFVSLLEKNRDKATSIADDMTDSLKRVGIIETNLSKLDAYESEMLQNDDNGGKNEI